MLNHLARNRPPAPGLSHGPPGRSPDPTASLDEETISSTNTIVSRVRRRVNAQLLLSVITITGIRDHHRLERLITIPGMRRHIAKKTKAFVASVGGTLRLFYLPPYSPDRNPDELVWKHLKADTVGRASIASLADFRNKVKSFMLSLQRNREKLRSFFHKPSLKYAA